MAVPSRTAGVIYPVRHLMRSVLSSLGWSINFKGGVVSHSPRRNRGALSISLPVEDEIAKHDLNSVPPSSPCSVSKRMQIGVGSWELVVQSVRYVWKLSSCSIKRHHWFVCFWEVIYCQGLCWSRWPSLSSRMPDAFNILITRTCFSIHHLFDPKDASLSSFFRACLVYIPSFVWRGLPNGVATSICSSSK